LHFIPVFILNNFRIDLMINKTGETKN